MIEFIKKILLKLFGAAKQNKKKIIHGSYSATIIIALITNLSDITDAALKIYDRFFPPPHNNDKSEWRKEFEKRKPEWPENLSYVPYSERTLSGNKAAGSRKKSY